MHENDLVALYSHCNWALLDGTCELLWVHSGNINKVSDPCCLFRPIGFASVARKSLVRVVSLRHDSMILCVPKCTVHCSTHAALVPIDLRAVNELLLANIDQMPRFKEVSTLNDTSCSECPIRAADVLVLYWSHSTSFHPIDRLYGA